VCAPNGSKNGKPNCAIVKRCSRLGEAQPANQTQSALPQSRAFWDALWLQQLRWEDRCYKTCVYGLRLLRKSPRLLPVAVSLAGARHRRHTAVFSVVDAVLLKMLQ